MSFSIIIPSRNVLNLSACVRAIRQSGCTARILVVWDRSGGNTSIDSTPDFEVVQVHDPFIFARNVNIGIRAAGEDDVLILNDDAVLQTPHGFDALAKAATEDSRYGLVAPAVKGVVGCFDQSTMSRGFDGRFLRHLRHHMLCFIAVYIRREVLNLVQGKTTRTPEEWLDERFEPGSREDDDLSQRVLDEGLRLGVFDGCVVEHADRPSTFRPRGKPDGYNSTANLNRFIDKWGFHPGKRTVAA